MKLYESLLLSFSCMSQLRVCLCSKVARSFTQHQDKSTNCSSWTCTHLCPVGIVKHEVWLSSLLYHSCLLVQTIGLLADQAFTNMGEPMRRWLHWKYRFTWLGPWTVILGVVVFDFNYFSCILVCLLACFLVCLPACFLTFLSLFLLLLLSFDVRLFACFIHRLVLHETMYDSWNKLGKIQEALCIYH